MIDVAVRMPQELGGPGGATNPEQLFAAGGFGIGVGLDVSLPNATPEQARQAVDRAHEVCPYSNATRNNIEVALSVV